MKETHFGRPWLRRRTLYVNQEGGEDVRKKGPGPVPHALHTNLQLIHGSVTRSAPSPNLQARASSLTDLPYFGCTLYHLTRSSGRRADNSVGH